MMGPGTPGPNLDTFSAVHSRHVQNVHRQCAVRPANFTDHRIIKFTTDAFPNRIFPCNGQCRTLKALMSPDPDNNPFVTQFRV